MVDEFTAILFTGNASPSKPKIDDHLHVLWSSGCVQVAEKSLNAKLWQENFTPEQSTRFF